MYWIENVPCRVCPLWHRNTCFSLFPGHSLWKLCISSQEQAWFSTGTHQTASPTPACPAAVWLPRSHRLLPTLEFAKWMEKIKIKYNPRDLTLPHVFKASGRGLQDTVPQGKAAATGSQILVYHRIQSRENLTKAKAPSFWQETRLEYLGSAIEITHLCWLWELLTPLQRLSQNARICKGLGK